jgi:hypothetical protein
MAHLASSRFLPRSAPLFHLMLYSINIHMIITLHCPTSGMHCQNKTVPGTSELLIVSPMIPKYTVHNRYLNSSTTVTVEGFDVRSLQETIPPGAAAYVQSVSVTTSNGDVTTQNASRCNFDFYDAFRVGADIVITVTADRDAANNCGVSLPQSISTGGFAKAR